jgi:hypothetical protein
MAEKAILDDFEQVDDSKNVSQLVRRNAPQYWRYMRDQANLHRLEPYLPFEGIIAGDPHMGNFGILPLRTDTGARQMKYVNIDFDDAGHGPFALDFVHLLVTSRAVGSDIRIRHLADAYLEGLSGREIAPPTKLRRLLDMPVGDYDAAAQRYSEAHSSSNRFRFKAGKIEPYDGRIGRSTIEALFAPAKVIDVGLRPIERGGSVGELRIWVLVEGRGPQHRIIELKQYAEPATAIYRPQPPVRQWLKEVRSAFWPGLDGSEYDLVKLTGNGWFWVREKRVPLLDVPYASEKKKRIKFRDKLASYDANQLGLVHGRQSKAYYGLIKTDTKAFRARTKDAGTAYLRIAKKAEAERPVSRVCDRSEAQTLRSH